MHYEFNLVLSTQHRLSRRRNPRLRLAEISLTKISDMGTSLSLCSYDHAAEGIGIKVVKSALDYFVIHGGGNDQHNVEITSLAELLPCNFGVY
jgi:hypothetical protein